METKLVGVEAATDGLYWQCIASSSACSQSWQRKPRSVSGDGPFHIGLAPLLWKWSWFISRTFFFSFLELLPSIFCVHAPNMDKKEALQSAECTIWILRIIYCIYTVDLSEYESMALAMVHWINKCQCFYIFETDLFC